MNESPGGGRRLTLFEAILPLVTMLVLFVVGARALGLSAELLVSVMLGAAAVAGAVAVRHGHDWDAIQRSTGEKVASVLPAILILLTIGMLIGTWVLGGTIPYLVYWGVRLVSPEHLVVTAFLATAVMSLCTGTSWGSAGTIGVALMGTAAAVGAPLPATAGAVVSGAYFGDKMSPLSDSTNISAIGAGADLYRHVRHMIYTAFPSFVLALVVYVLFAGSGAGDSSRVAEAERLLVDLGAAFRLHWIVLLPPIVVVVAMVRRVPPVLAMALSSVVAAFIGTLVQGFGVADALIAGVSGFNLSMVDARAAGPGEWSDALATLVNRGGLYAMVDTLLVVIAAFLLAGALDVSGALDLVIDRMLGAVRSTFGLISATMASGATMIAVTSHGGVTALIIGGLYQKAYRERHLAPENLSRSIEDSVTIVEPLMPWTVSAVFMAGTLGVSTVAYAPWAVFCFCGPVFSLLYGATYDRTGFGIRRAD